MKGFSIHLLHLGKANFIKVVLMLAVLLMMAQPAFASNADSMVFPPDSTPYGKTINEWTAAWWQYVMSFPASKNPLADATGANCADKQSDPVFFLAGTTGGSAVRDDCVVPFGTSILFPVINVIAAVPEDGATAADIVSLASWYESHTDNVNATVDGVNITSLKPDYRFPSPIFSFVGANHGIFAPYYEGYRATAFSDGWWVMLTPLTLGPHTIHFLGHLKVPEWKVDFTTEVTYHLVVK